MKSDRARSCARQLTINYTDNGQSMKHNAKTSPEKTHYVARTNRNPAVRKQAMFWLGQSNDPRALKFIEDILMH